MAFQQLYYTSCEHGLSGLPGYQFNAVTPGVPIEVMREVERITAYEPPPGLAYEPAGGALDAYPVSLCFSPGEATILASVVFAGSDFSNRFGNYFAHALVTTAPEADLGDVLPIEAWQAPFWVSVTAASTSLPALAGPLPRGPIDREHVQAFLDDHHESSWLPALLTAVARAVGDDGRPVVLVSAGADDNARWIAAVSYLLPNAMARRMSFTTYHRRPSYCPLQVIGTLPDRDAEWDPNALGGSVVFDFVRKECGDIEIQPLAVLLARAGPVAAGRLWRQAAALGSAAGSSFDDWYGPVAAAAAVVGIRLTPADIDAAVDWFVAQTERRQLDPGLASSVAEALLGHATRDENQLRAVISAARQAGAGDLIEGLDDLEAHLMETELARVESGKQIGSVWEIGSPSVTDRARQICEGRLADADAPAAIALLRWAAGARVPLGDQALAGCGERLGRGLLSGSGRTEVREVLDAWPALRRGVVTHLAHLASRDPDAVMETFGPDLGLPFDRNELSSQPRLHELLLIHEARSDPSHRVAALAEILAGREHRHEQGGVEELLHQLWRDRRWSTSDARLAVKMVDRRLLACREIAAWLAGVLQHPPEPGDSRGWEDYLHLCHELADHPVRKHLPDSGRDLLAWVERIEKTERLTTATPTKAVGLVGKLSKQFGETPPPVQALLLDRLPELLSRVEGAKLAEVLAGCPRRVVQSYLVRARPALQRAAPDATLGASLFLAAHRLQARRHPYGELVMKDLLAAALPGWKRGDLDVLLAWLHQHDVDAAAAFTSWCERLAPAGLRARMQRLLWRQLGGSDPEEK